MALYAARLSSACTLESARRFTPDAPRRTGSGGLAAGAKRAISQMGLENRAK
jgi:hypothetical protein